jgi:hypothetical protein
MRWRPMNPEHGMCATIGILTSRADNIALGTSGYAHRPAGPSIAIAAGRSGEGLLEEAMREVGRQRRTRKATPRNTTGAETAGPPAAPGWSPAQHQDHLLGARARPLP